jgi:hypothetical protein
VEEETLIVDNEERLANEVTVLDVADVTDLEGNLVDEPVEPVDLAGGLWGWVDVLEEK